MPSSKKAQESNRVKSQLPYARLLLSPTFTLHVGPSKKALYVHKELLAEISPELRKHTHNEMKEGIENAMTLGDVQEDTVIRFLEWAYTGCYTDDINLSETTGKHGGLGEGNEKQENAAAAVTPFARLFYHLRLYVFADRFNVFALKQLTFDKITAILRRSLGYLKDSTHISSLIKVLDYAFSNLVLDDNNSEKLLHYLGSYAAWNLDLLRKDSSFDSLIANHFDLSKILLMNAEEAELAPWQKGEDST